MTCFTQQLTNKYPWAIFFFLLPATVAVGLTSAETCWLASLSPLIRPDPDCRPRIGPWGLDFRYRPSRTYRSWYSFLLFFWSGPCCLLRLNLPKQVAVRSRDAAVRDGWRATEFFSSLSLPSPRLSMVVWPSHLWVQLLTSWAENRDHPDLAKPLTKGRRKKGSFLTIPSMYAVVPLQISSDRLLNCSFPVIIVVEGVSYCNTCLEHLDNSAQTPAYSSVCL